MSRKKEERGRETKRKRKKEKEKRRKRGEKKLQNATSSEASRIGAVDCENGVHPNEMDWSEVQRGAKKNRAEDDTLQACVCIGRARRGRKQGEMHINMFATRVTYL